jgi:Methylamine utilisation protein MauE
MQALALFLIAVLAASALHKLLARKRLVAVAARLAGVALPGGALLLALAATLEALTALALVLPALRSGAASAAATLWLGYGFALWRQRGKILDCGCDLVAREQPIGIFVIARPLLLAALAGTVALTPTSGWTLDAPFAALALLALWFAASELHSIPKPMRTRS